MVSETRPFKSLTNNSTQKPLCKTNGHQVAEEILSCVQCWWMIITVEEDWKTKWLLSNFNKKSFFESLLRIRTEQLFQEQGEHVVTAAGRESVVVCNGGTTDR